MKRSLFVRVTLLALALIFCLMAILPALSVFSAAPTRYCYTTAQINFRAAPSTSADKLLSGTLGKYQVLPVLGEVTGTSVNGSTLWYQVSYVDRDRARELIGYVHSSYAVLCEPFDFTTELFSDFPVSYRPYLAALQKAHPSWVFLPDDTGRDWSSAVAAQSKVTWDASDSEPHSNSFVYTRYSPLYRAQDVIRGVNVSGVVVDGGSMYCANSATVSYFMDPRNFLNEVDIFMFSQQSFDEDVHTLAGLENMMKGTYMEGLTTVDAQGKSLTYAEAFYEAGRANGLNPYYLLITSFTENGKTGTGLSKGNLGGEVCSAAGCDNTTHRGYYNFFGIGSTPGGSPMHNGLVYAVEKGWDTAYKAIMGGASFQSNSYISLGQDTPYFKKFNVSSYTQTELWHQYMQNLCHPENEAWQIFDTQRGQDLLDIAHTFVIPIFDDMPESPCTLPTPDSPGDTGGDAGGGEESEGKPSFSTDYTLDYSGYISGIAPNTTSSALVAGFTLGAGTTVKTSSAVIGTGSAVRILYQGEQVYYFDAVVRGDLSGDGQIKALDLLYLRDYLLGNKTLRYSYLKAADVDGNGKVDALDLLKLRDAILGIYTISQKG